MPSEIKRIFFDSGMVLVYPRSGEWFYPIVHREYCEERGLPQKTFLQGLNYARAYANLHGVRTIRTEAEEYEAFLAFYAALFRGIKGKDDRGLIEACASAIVTDHAKYAFYDDVADSIARLERRYDLGIISDAWPSLLSLYEAHGMRGHFSPFIISSMYGCTKEGVDLFKFALANVAEHPENILFVDDSYGNCARASKLGMQAMVLNRNKYYRSRKGMPHVSSMAELESALGI